MQFAKAEPKPDAPSSPIQKKGQAARVGESEGLSSDIGGSNPIPPPLFRKIPCKNVNVTSGLLGRREGPNLIGGKEEAPF
ncbi:hypothetical protein TTHERM_002653435 (macronuclear) [Tetrahymena thermophila SB210]|uniref:Uncharacterized protein n=1 Tax=Tetrahymena thermophila (strain SB210) TaxID=312017 RepID=W7X539_TETTS|nr:hypothetical protein TTHERM_002653435 [Tetrahymena thermophila SB210]EWS71493.1 hypothetical protein TTHERM_002653435 [Tetrahymena thermophila SB210]|eukprot:XP_012655972.1 hypothetical protein TTHERM_002653435 [Tetrahymena thermophila SB210]